MWERGMKMSKMSRATFLALASVLTWGCQRAEDRRAPELSLATWNIEWLNHEDGTGPNKREPVHYKALARYARALNADVVALQEVDGAEGAARVFDPQEYAFHFSSRDDLQRVGFAYRKGLEVTRHEDLVWLARVNSERLRYGVDMTVHDPRTSRSLRVLVVHLKSGCFSSPLDGSSVVEGESPKACAHLSRQIPVLKKWIARRVEEGRPFAILGDFNRRLKPGEQVWEELRGASSEAGLSSPTLRARSTCWGGRYPDLIDHMILDARAARSITPNSFAQVNYSPGDLEKHGRRLSDHCPLKLELR